jgi:hypothetical protein
MRRETRLLPVVALTILPSLGCRSESSHLSLVAPFNEHAKIGEVTATWVASGEERTFAGGARLRQPEMRFQYRVQVRNLLQDKLYVELADFQLTDAQGMELAADSRRSECVLAAEGSAVSLAGEIWLPRRSKERIAGFEVRRFAAPLSERGRALYREWLLQGRPRDTAEVDKRFSVYAGAPQCGAP